MVKIWIFLMILSGLMVMEHKKELDRWDESISVKEILQELAEARSPYSIEPRPTQIKMEEKLVKIIVLDGKKTKYSSRHPCEIDLP